MVVRAFGPKRLKAPSLLDSCADAAIVFRTYSHSRTATIRAENMSARNKIDHSIAVYFGIAGEMEIDWNDRYSFNERKRTLSVVQTGTAHMQRKSGAGI